MSSATYATFHLADLPKPDTYKLLAGTILPRPIAWITTVDAEGRINAAPFSFFNVVSSDPPLVVVGFSGAPDREGKDTLANIRATGELVVNMVPEELAQAMNITATDAPRGTDEVQLAGLETMPSTLVTPPRIAGTPTALECRTFQILDTGSNSTVLLATVVAIHVRRDVFLDEERLHVEPANMRLVGRMHGAGGYTRTRDTYEIPRINWKEMAASTVGKQDPAKD
jgi:flavin reductase (DIM6/NTAB) family NADH-FMN oxidoreductase RutF